MKILSIEGENGVNLYPNEIGGGVVISQDEMRIISNQYHAIYEPIIYKLCEKIINHTEIKSDNLEIIMRYALIPILYAFVVYRKIFERNSSASSCSDSTNEIA